MNIVNLQKAIDSYNKIQKAALAQVDTIQIDKPEEKRPKFSSVLGVVQKELDKVKVAERAVRSDLQQSNTEEDLLYIVSSVNEAQMTLDAIVSVRDKMVNAINDILKMPI